MIIGIDGGFLSTSEPSKKTGVYQIGVNFLREISKIDKNNKYKIFVFDDVIESNVSFPPNFSLIKVIPSRGWNYFGLPLYLLKNKTEIYIGFSQNLPFFCPSKKLVFVYDVAFQKYPNLYKNAKKLNFQTKLAVMQADKIICTSKSTRNDLVDLYSTNSEKIRVIYPGYDNIYRPSTSEEIKIIKDKYNLNNDYFLFVGSLRKIKNIPFLIRGFLEFAKKSRGAVNLILCGGFSWFDEGIDLAIKNSNTGNKLIIKLGHVPREDLPALYSGANALVSPSLYEGFGFTLIEAMACECPVIASNVGSLPEVVGQSAILINPLDVEQLVKALFTVRVKNVRENLIFLGKRQIKKYNWENFTHRVVKEINKLCPS